MRMAPVLVKACEAAGYWGPFDITSCPRRVVATLNFASPELLSRFPHQRQGGVA